VQISLLRTSNPPPRTAALVPQLRAASSPYFTSTATTITHSSTHVKNTSSLYRAASSLQGGAAHWTVGTSSEADNPAGGTERTSDVDSLRTYSEASEPLHSQQLHPLAHNSSVGSARFRGGVSMGLSRQSSSQWCEFTAASLSVEPLGWYNCHEASLSVEPLGWYNCHPSVLAKC
jgi:hypothetical protein